MRILVTGAAGFIGANLCRELGARSGVKEVIGLDDLSSGDPNNLRGTRTALVTGSILDQNLIQDLVDGVDAVIHLAARPSVPRSLQDPMASHEANATGSLRVLEACRRRSSMWSRHLRRRSTAPSTHRENTRTSLPDPPVRTRPAN